MAPGLANSGGTLALHLTGNLQHFIGAVLGGGAATCAIGIGNSIAVT